MTFGAGGAFASISMRMMCSCSSCRDHAGSSTDDPEPAPLESTSKETPKTEKKVAFETDLQAGDVLYPLAEPIIERQ